jgi:hypothetical protein
MTLSWRLTTGTVRRFALAMALALVFAVAGCAALRPTGSEEPVDMPALRLPPAALGRSLALHQHLKVETSGQVHRLDVLLEADASQLRLAMLVAGQTAARLEWDGRELKHTSAPWWPAAVSAERVLSDLQLVMWPAPAVRAALPAGWSLQADDRVRVLSREGRAIATVRYEDAQHAELVQHTRGYRLNIVSQPLGNGT